MACCNYFLTKVVIFSFLFNKQPFNLGVSTGRVGSGLGLTWNRLDLVEWLDGRPAVDREKSRVKSDQARMDSSQI